MFYNNDTKEFKQCEIKTLDEINNSMCTISVDHVTKDFKTQTKLKALLTMIETGSKQFKHLL